MSKIIFYILGFIFIIIGQTCCQSENTVIRALGGTLCAIEAPVFVYQME